jgi:hypothetical protein
MDSTASKVMKNKKIGVMNSVEMDSTMDNTNVMMEISLITTDVVVTAKKKMVTTVMEVIESKKILAMKYAVME